MDVAVGCLHCVVVTEDGEVYSWGTNEQGQVGDPSTANKAEPTLISCLQAKNIIAAACGPEQVCLSFLAN